MPKQAQSFYTEEWNSEHLLGDLKKTFRRKKKRQESKCIEQGGETRRRGHWEGNLASILKELDTYQERKATIHSGRGGGEDSPR